MDTEGNTERDINLNDLLDISAFQDLSDSFTRLTGISTAILNLKGEVLTASGWQKICTEFHRKNPITASRCLESDTVLAGQLAAGEKYNVYKCKNGLVDVAVPIIIENKHVGNLFTGQFFFEPPDVDFFTQQAEEFGFDKDSYLESLLKVPVFSMERIKQALDFLTGLTVIIGNIGFDKKNLFELNIHLEQRIRDRTAELAESNERFKVLTEASFEGIVISEKDVIVETNSSLESMFGYNTSEFAGMKAIELVVADKQKDFTDKILSDFEKPHETLGQRKDGVVFPIEVQTKMFSYKGRQVKGAAIRDLTEHKKAQQEIEELVRQLKEAQKIAKLGHWELNLESNILFWSDETYRIFGLQAQGFKATYEAFIETVHPDDRDYVNRAYTDSVQRKTPYDIEHRILLKNGEIKWVREICVTEYNNEDEPIRSIGTIHDITDKKLASEEREKLINELKSSIAEVKTLRGILPICSYCKKVRDDSGYWEQVDVYIHKHSDADISHSICQDCMKEHNPEEYEALYGKNE